MPMPAYARATRCTSAARNCSRSDAGRFPAEFRRVASDLDQYCRDKEFKKADIAIDWLNTCLRNYDKQDNQGYCTRDQEILSVPSMLLPRLVAPRNSLKSLAQMPV